jgi:hypothetical protein
LALRAPPVVSIGWAPSAPLSSSFVAAPAGAPAVSAGCRAPLAPCEGAVSSCCFRRCPGCPDSFARSGRLSLETLTPCTTSVTPMSREVRAARRISCHWRLLSMPWFADGRREEGDGVMLLLPYAVSERAQCRTASPGHCVSACWRCCVRRDEGNLHRESARQAPPAPRAHRLGAGSGGESRRLHKLKKRPTEGAVRCPNFPI